MSKYSCTSFTWAIHNYSYCWQKTDQAIVSPTFCIASIPPEETKWKLLLYPRGVASADECIAFFLVRDKDCKGPERVRVEYTMDFIKADGTYIGNITKANETDSKIGRGSKRYLAKTRLVSQYLQQDILTIRFFMIKIDETATKLRQIFARTIIAIEKRFLQWTIRNFSNLEPDEIQTYLIKSESKEIIMQINLSVNNDNEKSICFGLYSFDPRMKHSTLKTFIIDSEKQEVDSGEFQYWFNCQKCSMFHLKQTMNDLMENKSLYLPNDSLNLSFELTVSTGIAFEGIEKGVYEFIWHPFSYDPTEDWRKCHPHKDLSDCPCDLITDLTSLSLDQSTCDMKLKTKTNIFPVHTLILSARSPVFKAMFSSDMKEKQNGCVDVSDLEDETVRRFLLYLYSDQLEDLRWNDALHLFQVADKYEVISLRKKCLAFLRHKMSMENACQALEFSDLYREEELKEVALNFILKHAAVIFRSEEWKILGEKNSKLALETMLRNWNDE